MANSIASGEEIIKSSAHAKLVLPSMQSSVTESVVFEIFVKCGEMQEVRMSIQTNVQFQSAQAPAFPSNRPELEVHGFERTSHHLLTCEKPDHLTMLNVYTSF